MFIDELYEKYLVEEGLSFGEANKRIFNEKAQKFVDLQRIENGYQLFRKKYPQAPEDAFRDFIRVMTPDNYAKMQKLFHWKVNGDNS